MEVAYQNIELLLHDIFIVIAIVITLQLRFANRFIKKPSNLPKMGTDLQANFLYADYNIAGSVVKCSPRNEQVPSSIPCFLRICNDGHMGNLRQTILLISFIYAEQIPFAFYLL